MKPRHIVIAAAAGTALVCAGTVAGEDSGRTITCAITLQTLAAPTDLKVDEYGTVRCRSGTGAYARTRGTAAIACEPRDPATHLMRCTETARLTAR
jgi:hypothetical protein